jgi:membrane-associated protein
MAMSDIILQLVNQYGYYLFFLTMGLGPFGVPIPNEVTMMTGGILAGNGMLHTWLVYLSSAAGLLSGSTTIFFVGKMFGQTLVAKLRQYKKMSRPFVMVDRLMDRYGNKALMLSCFLPGVRNLMPFVAGATGVPYRKLAIYSYSGAILWSLIYFVVGFHWGEYVYEVLITTEVHKIVQLVLSPILVYVLSKMIRNYMTKMEMI